MELTTTCPKCAKKLERAPNFCPACGEDLRGLTPTADTLSGPWSGRVIDGRYRLLEKLGEGGMGAVYKVEHVRMGKVLALKILRPDVAAMDKSLRHRFHQEARVVSKLSHPNTIQVFDFGELPDGSLYIAMEFVPGRDLAWLLRAQGPMPEEKAIAVALQVLSSLGEAHEMGIVHRDIKPANVILMRRKGREDLVKVLDFGIAKLNDSESRKRITGVADLLGSPAYMSPEQARGDPLDARSDLYSVGALLFELVTGRCVFVGPTPMSVVTQHLTKPPPRLYEVAPGLQIGASFERVVHTALAKNPADRFPSAEKMKEALEQVRCELGALTNDFTPLPEELVMRMASREDFDQFERGLRRRRLMAPLVTLGVVATLGLGGLLVSALRGDDAIRPAEREPNDEPAQANRLALGEAIEGTMGAGKEGRSDRDLYLLHAPPGHLRVVLSRVEDLNLTLELSALEKDDGGKERLRRQLFLDDLGVGEPEQVDGFFHRGGPLYLRVEESAHFQEPPRSPREKSTVAYELRVEPSPGQAQEQEPNDTLERAHQVPWGRPVQAYAGAQVPYPPPRLAQIRPGAGYLSTVDFFLAEAESSAKAVGALLVPPHPGTLWAVDASAFETWELKSLAATDPAAKAVPPPSPLVVGRPELLVLKRSSSGYALRVQPGDGSLSGAPYQLVFVHDGPNGLAGAIELARQLDERGELHWGQRVLQLAANAFPSSPQASMVKAMISGP